MDKIKRVFCLMGPTASGKTDLACALVQHLPCEIISVDSAMIYRHMNIGTAKPSADVLAQAPHHLIDILDPIESYSAAQFCTDVVEFCTEIINRGNIPLLVGGTMMYFRALQQGLSVLPQADENIRMQILNQAQQNGWDYLHEVLATVDPLAAQRIHPHDTQRLQRALEVYQITGKSLSALLAEKAISTSMEFTNFLLMPASRVNLHTRIFQRFEAMLHAGFIEEVVQLLQQWPLTSEHSAMRSVGYRQVVDYLQGNYDKATLLEKGVAATRQLAKRQLTWLRHWPDGHRFVAENANNLTEMIAKMQQILDNS